MKRRLRQEKGIEESVYDILIVGGGITGAGAFLEASKRGYKTVLVEKGDFASGTSSRSAKLVHGGMRYLRYAHFGLVREALLQRDYLLKTYPHLVKPLRFLYPLYSARIKIELFMALFVYQILNITSDLFGFNYLNKQETLTKFPAINDKNLLGSYRYYDAVTNDARLCNEIIHEAVSHYSSVALNYFELTSFETQNEQVVAQCIDHIEGKKTTITAKYVINASGPWMDEISKKAFSHPLNITAPSKGTHVVLSKKKFPIESSIIFSTKANDGRLLYTVPWENDTVIVGATDTEYTDKVDEVEVDVSDDNYILDSIRHITPSLNITKDDILSSFAGVRPLLKDENLSSKDRSREYKIWWAGDRVLNMFGGKLTGFHSMAEKAIKMVAKRASGKKPDVLNKRDGHAAIDLHSLPKDLIEHIKEKYHSEDDNVFTICLENPLTTEKLHPEFDIYIAEIIYFVRHQSCYHIDDVLGRRLSLSYVLPKSDHRVEVARKVADVLRVECGWTEQEYLLEQENYLALLKTKNLYL